MNSHPSAVRDLPIRAELAREDDVEGAVSLMAEFVRDGVAPASIVWSITDAPEQDLFAAAASARRQGGAPVPVPEGYAALAGDALLHSDDGRFALLHRLLDRLQASPGLLGNPADADVARAHALAKAVRRDRHKMTAFVRFREVAADDGAEAFVAWFEPAHHILRATAPFFVKRFASMRWSILTPTGAAHWDGRNLLFDGGRTRLDAPTSDRLEDVWRTYYGSIFNPARLKLKAMAAEMPKRYWRDLPEAALIRPLAQAAESRARAMVEAAATSPLRRIPALARYAPQPAAAAAPAPVPRDLPELAAELRACRRCPLHACATQAVPGLGPAGAGLMIVGEQPGDQEDLSGRAFVGPAGRLLDTALERIGIDRAGCYVTNAVKHFKFEPRGKRRIHKTPSASEVEHCRWWLDAERRIVAPRWPARSSGGRSRRRRRMARCWRRRTACPWSSPRTRPTCCACPTTTGKRSASPGRGSWTR
jgi:uracil-DNA glycosylase